MSDIDLKLDGIASRLTELHDKADESHRVLRQILEGIDDPLNATLLTINERLNQIDALIREEPSSDLAEIIREVKASVNALAEIIVKMPDELSARFEQIALANGLAAPAG